MSKSLLVSVFALVALVAGPALAGAPAIADRKGVEILGSLGLNMCQEDGDAKCDDIGPSVQLNVAPGFRIMPHVGAYLDIGYGMLSPDAEGADSMSTLSVIPMVRGYLPLGPADIHLGVGAGYTRSTISGKVQDTDISITRTNATDAKISVGGAYYLSETLAIGATIDMIFLANEAGEACTEFDGNEECADIKGDASDLLQAGVFARFRL